MKLLFQGDSITDAKRNRSDIHDLGQGYPLYAAEEMKRLYPGRDFEFINLAYSGNHTLELVERLEPFLGPVEDKALMRWDLDNKIQIVRRLAREYADHYIPTDGLLAQAYVKEDFLKFAADGVHPTPYGAAFLGKLYAREIKALL